MEDDGDTGGNGRNVDAVEMRKVFVWYGLEQNPAVKFRSTTVGEEKCVDAWEKIPLRQP